jgi:hypothetical protein
VQTFFARAGHLPGQRTGTKNEGGSRINELRIQISSGKSHSTDAQTTAWRKKKSHTEENSSGSRTIRRTDRTEPNKSERPAAVQEKKKNGEGKIQVQPAAEETEQRPDNTKIG